jgi:5-methylthioribose kinase
MTSELDIEAPGVLIDYLRGAGRIDQDEEPVVRVLGGGVSNRAVLVQRPSGEAWVVKQALAELREILNPPDRSQG